MLDRLREDIRSVKDRDPAATSTISVLANYPGLHALWAHRINHWFWSHGRRGFARWGSENARFLTGIEIHPGATIGRRFFIDHGMGVVIGETTVIGDDVTLYQGVTLGGTGKEHGKRHPTLQDCVVVGVGATVLGNITIGHGSKVGGGAVVVRDVPPHCTVVGVPGRVVRQEGSRVDTIDLHHEDLPDPVVEMFRALQRRIERIEQHTSIGTIPSEEDASEPIENGDDGTYSVETDEWDWQN
jgi:serine O-acetyltransferase